MPSVSPPVSPRSTITPTTTAASAENSILVEPSYIHATPMRVPSPTNRLNQTTQSKKPYDFSNHQDVESLEIVFKEHYLNFSGENCEALIQFIQLLQEVVNKDTKQIEAFNDHSKFKKALLELVVQHLNLLCTEDVKTILSLLNGIAQLPYESSYFKDLSLDGIINTINTTFKISIEYYSKMLSALGKLPLKLSDHPAFEELTIDAVISAFEDTKFSWDNRSYSMILNALGNLGFRISSDSSLENLNLQTIINALNNPNFYWENRDYSLTLNALGKLGYHLNTHPEIETLNLETLKQLMNDPKKPWDIRNYSLALKGLSRLGFHLNQHPELRQLNLELINYRLKTDLKSFDPLSIAYLLFSLGKLGFQSAFNWNTLHLALLKQYILSQAFNTYERDTALKGWKILGLGSLLQQQIRQARQSQPLPAIFSQITSPQAVRPSVITPVNPPIKLLKSTLIDIPPDQLKSELIIQPGELIASRIATVKYLQYPKRMIDRLQGNIELRNRNGQKSGLLINRLEFLRFLAITLQHSGFAIKGIYLMGSMVHELLGYKDREDNRDYDFCIQVDGSTDTHRAIEQALKELNIQQHVGVSKIDNAAIRILKLGFNNTDITITKGNLKYALLDNAIALNISEVLAQWQNCLKNKYPQITQYYLYNKDDVETALENRHINFPKKSPTSDESPITWDKTSICFKRLSRGEPFANSEDAIKLYSALSNALVSADQSVRNADNNNFNQNLQLRSVIYHKFEQLPSSALLHGILDIAVRMEELQQHSSWTPEKNQTLNTFLKTLTNWFNHKAQQERKFLQIRGQLNRLNNSIEIFAQQAQQLIRVNQQFYNVNQNDWGKLYTDMESILIYIPSSASANQPIENWPEQKIKELYETAKGLKHLQIADHINAQYNKTQLSIAADQPLTSDQSSQSLVGKTTHWRILGRNIPLFAPIDELLMNEQGLPTHHLIINYQGSALTLSNFKFSNGAMTILADVKLKSNWRALTDVSVVTTCEINSQAIELDEDNTFLTHGNFWYYGSVDVNKNPQERITSIIPSGDGILHISPSNDTDNKSLTQYDLPYLKFEGDFEANGLIQVDTTNLFPGIRVNFDIQQKDIFTNPNEFKAKGEITLENGIKFKGSFLCKDQRILPLEGKVFYENIAADLKIMYQKNRIVFINLIRQLDKQKVQFLLSENTLALKLTYTHRSKGKSSIENPEIKELTLISQQPSNGVAISNIKELLMLKNWHGDGELVSANTSDARIPLKNFDLLFKQNQCQLHESVIKSHWHNLDYLYPIIDHQSLLDFHSANTHAFFQLPVYNENIQQFIPYTVAFIKNNSVSDPKISITSKIPIPYQIENFTSIDIKDGKISKVGIFHKRDKSANINLNETLIAKVEDTLINIEGDFANLDLSSPNKNFLEHLTLSNKMKGQISFDGPKENNFEFDEIAIDNNKLNPEQNKMLIFKKIQVNDIVDFYATLEMDLSNSPLKAEISFKHVAFNNFKFQIVTSIPSGFISIEQAQNAFKIKVEKFLEVFDSDRIAKSTKSSNKKFKNNLKKLEFQNFRIAVSDSEIQKTWQSIKEFCDKAAMAAFLLSDYIMDENIEVIRRMIPILPSLVNDLQQES